MQSACASLLSALGVARVDLVLLDASRYGNTDSDVDASAPLPPALASAWSCASLLTGSGAGCVGLSHAGWRCLEALLAGGGPTPAALAADMHPLLPRRRLCGLARRRGLALVALQPLAPNAHPAVVAAAAAAGQSPDALLLRYSVQRGVAAAPEGVGAAEAGAAFAFRLDYPLKVTLDALSGDER